LNQPQPLSILIVLAPAVSLTVTAVESVNKLDSCILFVATTAPFTRTLYSLLPYGAECLTIRLYSPPLSTVTFSERLSVAPPKFPT